MLFLLAALTAVAGTEHEVELAVGAQALHKTDLLISPLPLSGAAPSASLGWAARGDRATHKVSVSFAPGSLRSGPAYDFEWGDRTIATSATATVAFELQYAVGWSVQGVAGTLNIGGTMASRMEQVDIAYGFTGTSSYLGLFEFAPWVEWRGEIGRRHQVTLEGWVPLAAWNARSPWSLNDTEQTWNNRDHNAAMAIVRYIGDGAPHTWNQYQAAHLRATYSVHISGTFDLFARARGDVLHFTKPARLAQWTLGGEAGVRGRF